MKPAEVSVVVPIFNEEETIEKLVEALQQSMSSLDRTYELILVDDGSTDLSAKTMMAQAAAHSEVRCVFLKRNYGQSTALQAGFDEAQGRLIVTLDADLQNDPADIPRLIDELEQTEADVVSGWRYERNDAFFRVFLSRLANNLISIITNVPLHDFGCTLKVYRKETLQHVKLYGEQHRFIPVYVAQAGGLVSEIKVHHREREFGVSKYGYLRIIKVLLDAVFLSFVSRFFYRPMHFFGFAGLTFILLGGLAIASLAVEKYILGANIGGRPLLIVSLVAILMGVLLIGQGVIAEMILRVLHEPAGRRTYFIAENKQLDNSK